MRNYILGVLLKLYRKDFREITKLSSEEDFELHLFKTPDDVLKLMKSKITYNMIKEFENNSNEEKLIAKGAALAFKMIKDAHEYAYKIESKFDDDQEKKMELWKKYKFNK